MRKISIQDVRENLTYYIDQVAVRKKKFLITKYGRPKAMLVPVDDSVYVEIEER